MNTLENIFVQIPNYIFWKDTRSCFLGCNSYFAQAAGLNTPSEIKFKTDFELAWADTHAELYQQGDQQVLDSLPLHNRIEPQLQTNGKLTSILINKAPLFDQNGQKIGVIGSYTEICDPRYYGKFDLSKKNIALTKKQTECLFYLASGMLTKQIANKMEVSTRTTEYHINLLKIKLKCINKSSLIAKALELDFIKIRLFGELSANPLNFQKNT